ncbi:MAG: methionine--tRNA ligase, partial [Dehalococcoidaceae bacterium]|nr:methionine--tRNA ligase [Dehalococcoidaceae bacterium]
HFNDDLIEWIKTKKEWRAAVRNFTLGQLNDGLKDRAITRDINWGIDIPMNGYEDKKIYVWFEAVLGYLSATIEYSKNNPSGLNWEDFWKDKNAHTVYFQGKDNVPFHAMILPAILLGYGQLNLPYDIPANQYVMMGGDKASSSRNTAIWVPDYLKHLSADQLRYYLTCIMPETSDSEFNWEDFVSRNNDELAAKWGNLVQRVISFTNNRMGNKIPTQESSMSESNDLKKYIQDTYITAGNQIEKVELRAALSSIMNAAQETNKYLEKTEPWKKIKENKKLAEESIFCALEAIYNIAILLYPFVPFSSNDVLKTFGNESIYSQIQWEYQEIIPGTELKQLDILFEKLELSEINKIF